MAQIAVGLVESGTQLGAQEQVGQGATFGPLAVAAGTDLLVSSPTANLLLQPARDREIVSIDNCWAFLQASDASGQLQVLETMVFLGGVSGALNNGGIVGVQTDVPQSLTFGKVAAAPILFAFEFVPIKTSLVARHGENLALTFTFVVRNNDGVNPHSFSGFLQAFYHVAQGLG